MSSFLEKLAEKAAVKAGDVAAAWPEKLAAELEKRPLGDTVRAPLVAFVREKAPELSKLTAAGFAAVVSHLALGEVDEARLVWLRAEATYDEQMDALDAAFAENRRDVRQKEETWAAIKQTALELLKQAAVQGLPILLKIALAAL